MKTIEFNVLIGVVGLMIVCGIIGSAMVVERMDRLEEEIWQVDGRADDINKWIERVSKRASGIGDRTLVRVPVITGDNVITHIEEIDDVVAAMVEMFDIKFKQGSGLTADMSVPESEWEVRVVK
jgi:hypothetical protein